MMTAADFRRLALSLPDAIEGAHMGHADFRVRGKIFATLGYPDKTQGMVKLTPEQQRAFCQSDSAAFVPVKGAWGEKGATNVRLRSAREGAVEEALAAACANVPKTAARKRR
jgi:hypothetical protein